MAGMWAGLGEQQSTRCWRKVNKMRLILYCFGSCSARSMPSTKMASSLHSVVLIMVAHQPNKSILAGTNIAPTEILCTPMWCPNERPATISGCSGEALQVSRESSLARDL